MKTKAKKSKLKPAKQKRYLIRCPSGRVVEIHPDGTLSLCYPDKASSLQFARVANAEQVVRILEYARVMSVVHRSRPDLCLMGYRPDYSRVSGAVSVGCQVFSLADLEAISAGCAAYEKAREKKG